MNAETDLSKLNGSELEAYFWAYDEETEQFKPTATCKKCGYVIARGHSYSAGFMNAHENRHIREMGYELIPGFSPNSFAIRKRAA